MKYLITLFSILTAYSYAFGQVTFEKIIDEGYSELAYCIKQCDDKGYILAGQHYSGSPYFHKIYLAKTDSAGNTLWTKDVCSGTWGYSVIPNNEGGYFILGKALGVTTALVIKTDSIGNIIWTESFENTTGYKMINTGDNNLIFVGYKAMGPGNRDIYLQKVGYDGSSLWSKSFGYGGFDIAYDIKLTGDNGFIIAGESQDGAGGNYEVYVIKTSPTGSIEWENKYSEGYEATAIDLTIDTGYILTGYNSGMLLMKLNIFGNVEWSKNLNGYSGHSVIQSHDIGYLAAGYRNNHFYVVKTDQLGNMEWENEFPKGFFSRAKDVIATNDFGFAIAGICDAENGYDIYFIKIDENGCIQPKIKSIEGPQNVTVGDTILFHSIREYGTGTFLYNWECGGELISGQGNDTVRMVWNQTGIDSILLITSNSCGTDSIYHNIQILDCVNPLLSPIYGDSIVVQFDFVEYHVDLLEGTQPADYFWTISPGNIHTGQNTNHVTVECTQMDAGSIDVVCTNECGTDSSSKNVEITIPFGIASFDEELILFPNPSDDGIFNIEFGMKYHLPAEVKIFNLDGQLIYHLNCNNSARLDLSNCPKGIYLMIIESKNESVTKKLIIH